MIFSTLPDVSVTVPLLEYATPERSSLSLGPMVLQVPPGVLGPADDADFRWVTDVGLTGPDAGKGGKYLFVPPGYTGTLPSDGNRDQFLRIVGVHHSGRTPTAVDVIIAATTV
jgi:hypothetical protein